MTTRLSLVFLALLALGGGRQATASPITYAFTGTLQEPLDGSDQFSGSFSIDGDPTVNYTRFSPYGSVSEGGSDVSIKVNLGGQEFNFVNQPNSYSSASLTLGLSYSSTSNPSRPPQDELILLGSGGSGPLGIGDPVGVFGLTLYGPAKPDLSNLRDLSFLSLGTGSVHLGYQSGGSGDGANGSIDSIFLVPTPTPEPSTLAIFAVLGIAAMARRRP